MHNTLCRNAAALTALLALAAAAPSAAQRAQKGGSGVQECGGGVYCLNGGDCEKLFNTEGYQCSCPEGTRGTNCQVKVDDCGGGAFCTNGGTCQQLNNVEIDSICLCAAGYVGQHCETDAAGLGAAVCGPQVYCLNGGKCDASGTACLCAAGFTGTSCATAVSASGITDATRASSTAPSGSGGGGGLSGGAIAGIVIGAFVLVALAASIVFLIWRERRGRPVFVPFHDDEHLDTRRVITNVQLTKQFDEAPSTSMRRGPGGTSGSPV